MVSTVTAARLLRNYLYDGFAGGVAQSPQPNQNYKEVTINVRSGIERLEQGPVHAASYACALLVSTSNKILPNTPKHIPIDGRTKGPRRKGNVKRKVEHRSFSFFFLRQTEASSRNKSAEQTERHACDRCFFSYNKLMKSTNETISRMYFLSSRSFTAAAAAAELRARDFFRNSAKF